jgi:hypothetical protein
MKTTHKSERAATWHAAVFTTLLLSAAPTVTAQPGAETPTNGPERAESAQTSSFVMPTTLKEGHDPFFPNSTRFIKRAPAPRPVEGPVVLEFKGVSGTAERPLAIINNRTFAVGEEQDVNTANGKVKVMCLEIEGLKVKVRAQGETQELLLRKGI